MTTVREDIPAEFLSALRALRPDAIPAHMRIEEIPAPKAFTPYAAALSGEIVSSKLSDDILADGSLTLLYSPMPVDEWGGKFRFATIVRTTLDDEMSRDPLLYEVSRSWVRDSLASAQAQYRELRGTVTTLTEESFSQEDDAETASRLEIRASWAPISENPSEIYLEFKHHLESWMNLLFTTAGFPMLFIQR